MLEDVFRIVSSATVSLEELRVVEVLLAASFTLRARVSGSLSAWDLTWREQCSTWDFDLAAKWGLKPDV